MGMIIFSLFQMKWRSLIAFQWGHLKLILIILILVICHRISSRTPEIDSLIRIYENVAISKTERVDAALALSRHYLQIDPSLTGEYAAFVRRNTANSDSSYILCLDLLAKHHFFSGNLDSAEFHFQSAHSLATVRGDSSMAAKLGISLGSVLLRKTNYEEAISTLISSAEYFESRNNELDAAKCFSNISTAYANLENFKEAMRYSKRALQTFREKGMIQFISITLPNLATQYLKLGDTLSAVEHFQESIDLGLENQDFRSLGISYNNLGTLYLDRGDLSLARDYFSKSLASKQRANITKDIESIYYNLGNIFMQEGQFINAISQFEKAIQSPTPLVRISVFQRLKECYEALGNYERALVYADSSFALSDSVQQLSNAASFAEISAKYEQAKNENEILQLRADKQTLENIQNKNRFIIYAVLLALLAVIIVSFLIVKNQRKKRLIDQQEHQLGQEKMLKKMRDQELNAMDQIIDMQEKQRKQISAEVHDGLGSNIATLKLQLEHLKDRVDQDTRAVLSEAVELADVTYAEARNFSHNLNAGVMARDGLEPALRKMAKFASTSGSIHVSVSSYDLDKPLENNIEIQLFRIIQELVTNALKHSKAREVLIQLMGYDDSINITVEDDGEGFSNKDAEAGMGLQSVVHRCEVIGGTIEIDSGDNGTSVLIVVPI